MALSEIEKLERRYAENPQGLTFAPLAEVHRKNGDVARALELLRPGLELHPDYIPASIVLGRCHWDLGDLEASEAAFAHVLELDGENVIALKALADISERLHRFDKAERWLRQLLTVDRSNDEARVQLERIETARQEAAAAPPPSVLRPEPEAEAAASSAEAPTEPATAAEPAPTEPEAVSEPAPEAVAEPAPPPAAPREPDAEEPEPVPLALDDLAPTTVDDAAAEPPPPGLEVEEPPLMEEEVEPLADLVGREVDQPAMEEPEFRVETSEDIVLHSSGWHEFQVPNAAEELTSGLTPPAPFGQTALEPLLDEPVAEPPALVDVPAEPDLAAVVEPAPPPPPPPAPVQPAAEPEPVVTESMAEVLLQQGHTVEALHVYQELEARSPGDPHVRQRIAELAEADLRSQPAEEAAAQPRAYTAAETGGRSVGDLLRGILSQRLPTSGSPAPRVVGTPVEGAGAPTRPAADALSLSSVFGDEASPLPPAVPTAGAPPAGGVSYDEFFGQPGSSAGSPKPRGSDPEGDDLDQFHAWLQNLKR